MQRVGNSVYIETGIKSCCNHGFIVTRRGVVMIDTPVFWSAALRWREEIAKHGDLQFVVNTEYHADHFAGNCFFEGSIVAHEGIRKDLADASLEQVKQMLASIAPDNERIAEGFYIRLPVITFTEELTLYMESHTIRLILMPGHTPFETAVWVPEERMVFTSDNVVTKGMPFFGHSLPYEWLNSLEHLEELDFDYLVPGHGEISDRAGVAAMRTSLKACIDAVGEAVNSGMSLEEAKDRVNLTDFYPHLAENEKTMRWLERANIARLYTVLKGCS